ncbi:MAG: ABC transporter permease, partial [Candidatus Solibacter sp.]
MHTVRTLRRHWKPASIAVASLAIAMALGVICLSVSNTTLLLLPSAPAPDRLVTIYSRSAGNPVEQISFPDYRDYRANNHVFTDIAAAPNSISLLDDFQYEGRNIKVLARPVSDNYFAVMAIQPHLGRFFSPADSAADTHLAVMTYACWKRLGSDPKIVGKVLAGNTIIGVTPRSFTGSFYGLNGDLFVTLSQADNQASWEQRGARRLFLTARLKPGVSRSQAQAEMEGLSNQLAAAYPQDDKGRSAVVARASLLPPDGLATAELMTAILMALSLLVLLIACANVANLLLAIAVARRQEAAIKLALGASRRRLLRESLQESALLSMTAGVLGFALAAAALALYSDLSFSFPMFGAFSVGLNLRLDLTVAAMTLLLVLLATLATGLAPALYASSPHLASMLGGGMAVGGTHRNVRRSALVIVEVATCTLVMIGMGLCQRSLYNLRHIDLGFSARNLLAATLYLDAEGYSEKTGKPFYQTLRDRIAAIPGVESVSLAGDLPLLGATDVPAQLPAALKTTTVAHTVVDPNYFSTLGIKLLGGRNFNAA